MFGKEAKGLTLVYSYAGETPVHNLADAQIEMCLRVQLWNNLVDIEQRFQQKLKPLIETELDPMLLQMQKELTELEDEYKNQRQEGAYRTVQLHQARSLLNDSLQNIRRLIKGQNLVPVKKKKFKAIPEILFADFDSYEKVVKAIAKTRLEMKPLWDRNRVLKAEKRKQNKTAIDEIEAERAAAVKQARQQSGLYWGNYNDAIAKYEAARQIAGNNFHKKFPSGEGQITVQFTTPLQPAELFGTNKQLHLEPMADRPEGWFLAGIRIRSYPEREPVWLKLPVLLHRPLPDKCTIQTASVAFSRVGDRWEHYLNLTIRQETPAEVRRGKPTAKLNFCVHIEADESLHVATISSRDQSKQEKVVIPAYTTSQFKKVTDLRALQDAYQEKAAKAVIHVRPQAPAWFQEATQYVGAWKKADHFLKLWKTWKDARFDGDSDAFAAVCQFRERRLHLYPWEFNLRQQILRRRREQYRVLAARIVKEYDELWIPDVPVQTGARTQLTTNIQYWSNVAARYELRNTILNAARKTGVRLKDGEGGILFRSKKAARKHKRAMQSAA